MELFKVVDAGECHRRLFDFGLGKVSEGDVYIADLREGVVVAFNGLALTDDGKGVKAVAHISTE